MADSTAVLDQWIARVRELGTLAERAAPTIADELEREILANVAKGVGPDGTAWPATKDGHTPLQGTSRALSVGALGTLIVARLHGVHARHHRGAVKGGRRRAILPTLTIPTPVVGAIRRVLAAEFHSIMGSR